jgi:hypothetical protein
LKERIKKVRLEVLFFLNASARFMASLFVSRKAEDWNPKAFLCSSFRRILGQMFKVLLACSLRFAFQVFVFLFVWVT